MPAASASSRRPMLDPWMDDVKPVIHAGGSDAATLHTVFEVLVRAGCDAPMTKAVMEPWDGPAALAATDGRWVIAGLDRNGLRPLRYTISRHAMLIPTALVTGRVSDKGG